MSGWLLASTTQTALDQFCKLPVTRKRLQLSYKNKRAFFRKIDQLPVGPEWICDIITVLGDQLGPDGEPLTEEVELWRRDPVECCRDLLGNPAFREFIAYEPIRVFKDGVRYYGETNTADWWWEKQGELPEGAVVAAVFVASDKTTLTVLRGDQTAWPVYLTLGNIDKAVRRKPSAHASVLLGYIPVSKLSCFTKKTRSEAAYRLFHQCMAKMMEPLIAAGRDGVLMTCADGHIRRVFPILAAYIADHPEQCLIACCKENRCPRCTVPRKSRGDLKRYPLRQQEATARVLRQVGMGSDPAAFTSQGLRPVYEPFWAKLPHTDIFATITPDILHQLHKGLVKDHLLVWCQKIVGEKALDERFAAMSKSHGLRHFGRGVSMISQWTGTEAKEIEKVLLGLLVGRVPPRALKAIRGLLDFVYYAQYETHSDDTLALMQKALERFHRYKQELVELGVREHFNIPKLHSLVHYIEAIRRLGCLDGTNTESSERLHIDYAKKAYRASSRREYLTQMTTWLQRQEAVERRRAYLAWIDAELLRDLESDTLEGVVDGVDIGDEVDGEVGSTTGDDDDDDGEEHIKALRALLNSNVTRAYQLPLTPSARDVSVDALTTTYGVCDFLEELNLFLSEARPNGRPAAQYLTVNAFNYVNILLPPNRHISNQKRLCKLRAYPGQPRRNDRKAKPACFDCGLIIQDEEQYRTEGGLGGLRAGQVRLIFTLPAYMGYTKPLAFVRWFRSFRDPDVITDMPPTSHSTRAHQRNVSIVALGDIARPCHLIPKFGSDQTNATSAGEDILDQPITFLLNRYLDFHMFHALST
ncbi:hypothetical protein FKP32DRAFT_1560290 [Trametes sanguinea]|nr:hypothetical protein FKP32DRAFT_1560290 [Trametes sanguinea]